MKIIIIIIKKEHRRKKGFREMKERTNFKFKIGWKTYRVCLIVHFISLFSPDGLQRRVGSCSPLSIRFFCLVWMFLMMRRSKRTKGTKQTLIPNSPIHYPTTIIKNTTMKWGRKLQKKKKNMQNNTFNIGRKTYLYSLKISI